MTYYISPNTKLPSTEYVEDITLLQNTPYVNVSINAITNMLGLVPIANVSNTRPTNTSIQVVEKENTGNLYMTWMESSDYANTQSDLKASTIYRIRRNSLLSASDWTQMPDVPANTSIKWATYRQALRDITSQNTFPKSIIWPVKPDN